ncbi:hypothetical protein LCGC14_2439320 [marine sediment metagenome]|uniref:Uncharacterized protein n=1 Tax=marine sediment metagenome TaxID=412755 RepID=A0A0F9BJH7_9ZZZZ
MRGRLVNTFEIELAQLNTSEMDLDPDGSAGPLTSGYDDDFREPVVLLRDEVADDTTGIALREETLVKVPCQIEPQSWEQLRQLLGGSSPNAAVRIVFHFRDLERLCLIDPVTGEALIRNNDRLCSIFDCEGELIQEVRNPPGLFATQVRPTFGLGRSRNLLIATFEEREQGTL